MLQDHGTVTSRIVTEMARGVTMIVTKEDETATGIAMRTGTVEIAMTTGTVETLIEEVSCCACEGLCFTGISSCSLTSFQPLNPRFNIPILYIFYEHYVP